jgi:hydroxymethylbilane synthase
MDSNALFIGTRGSQLALWQAGWVKTRLEVLGYAARIKVIKTTGDRLPHAPLTQAGVKGLFIKELEEALAGGSIDLAVHSLKDLPVQQPENLYIAAVPARADPRDVLVSRTGKRLSELLAGSRLGTSSLRRQAQLQALRKDLRVISVRGNVSTRLEKVQHGDFDGLVLASAGLIRLGLEHQVTQYFSVEEMCPAAGQGALAIEIRHDDDRVAKAVRPLDDPAARCAVTAERAALRRLGGGCQTPIAVYARVESGGLEMAGVVANPEGTQLVRARVKGPADDAEGTGVRLALALLDQGAQAILSTA